MQIILASQSPYRQAQLRNFAITFQAVRPQVDEELLKKDGPTDLIELTRFLALKKAESLRADFSDAIILGSDQLVELDGERLDKPGTHERAKAQLLKMQGRSHRLITSLAVLTPGRTQHFTDITNIHMRALQAPEIEAYLTVDQPYDCAGSYKIERAGMMLIAKIESHDPSAIQGLPLISLTTALNELKVSWPNLWRLK